MVTVLLALVTAVSYGVSNYLGPLLGRRLPFGGVLIAGQIGASSGAAVIALLDGGVAISGTGLAVCAAAGVCNAGGIALFYLAGRTGDLSVVAPISATGAAVPVLYGLATGERPGTAALVGIPVALAGVVLAARRAAGHPGTAVSGLAVAYSLAGAASGGTFLTIYAHAQHYGAAPVILWSRMALFLTVAVTVAVTRTPARMPPREAARALVPGLLLVAGTYSFGEAASHGLVSIASVIATMNPVVTVGLALVLLHERMGRLQQVGAALAVGGVVLLAAG